MKRELRMISAGNLSLSETDISNVFLFFKKDGASFLSDDLNQMLQLAVGFLMKFMEVYEHNTIENLAEAVQVAISKDRKFIKVTLLDKSSFETGTLH